jgi:hypothetical protein
MKKHIVIAAVLLAGCASTKEVIIDRQGVDMTRYAIDKAECEQYAEEVNTRDKVLRGGASGAVVGGAVGAVIGDSSQSAAKGAGAGAITGAARGARDGSREEARVVKQCLRGRGYRVLN